MFRSRQSWNEVFILNCLLPKNNFGFVPCVGERGNPHCFAFIRILFFVITVFVLNHVSVRLCDVFLCKFVCKVRCLLSALCRTLSSLLKCYHIFWKPLKGWIARWSSPRNRMKQKELYFAKRKLDIFVGSLRLLHCDIIFMTSTFVVSFSKVFFLLQILTFLSIWILLFFMLFLLHG